ncbi:hypothetical protein BTJ39_17505 [Izhakiella australiensis]|uniref:Uncharacterized protein n=1 Tax=Izhakiella australiensis TaxID=1926881 RepID=A0A1S8YIB8_9GAMM|nr:hypothetical protein [Izhakiella australiensis]OON38652.1 hypothetical protein BTJ39_17505 [Izhakiella australiensis]
MRIADVLTGGIFLGISFFSAAQSVPLQPQPVHINGDAHTLTLNSADIAETPDEFVPATISLTQVREKSNIAASG